MAKNNKKAACSDCKAGKKKNVRLSGADTTKSIGMDVLCADISSTSNVSKSATKDIIDALWLAVQDHLAKGDAVTIHGVGTFRGQRRNIKGKVSPTIKFSLSPTFKKAAIAKAKSASVFPLHESKSKFPTKK